jgi:protein pelota
LQRKYRGFNKNYISLAILRYARMKITKSNLKQGIMKILPETREDLLDIYKVVETGDIVSGTTTRKIKIGDEDSTKSVKKSFFIDLEVEKKELEKEPMGLKLIGKISSQKEEIPLGSYHSLNISPNDELTIKKERWKNFQVERIKKSEQRLDYKVLVVIFDREEAVLAVLTHSGYEVIAKLKGQVTKKAVEEKGENFYKSIADVIEQKAKQLKVDHVLCASPGFYNDELKKELEPRQINSKVIFSHASNPGERGVAEVVKRDEVKAVLKEQKLNEENTLLQSLLGNISKNQKFAYGLKDVLEKAQMGAVDKLLINEDKVFSEEKSKEIEQIITLVEQTKGEVHIIESEEPQRILNSLGGIGAILRY